MTHLHQPFSTGRQDKLLFPVVFIWWILLRWECGSIGKAHQTSMLPIQVRFPGAARDFSPSEFFKCRLSYGVNTPLCAITCINICEHVKDPVVHVRVWWILETLKHPASSIGWVAGLSQLPCAGKATWISHGGWSHWDNTVVTKNNNNKIKLSEGARLLMHMWKRWCFQRCWCHRISFWTIHQWLEYSLSWQQQDVLTRNQVCWWKYNLEKLPQSQHYESLTMSKSWVNYHPLCTWWKSSSLKVWVNFRR